VDHASSKHRGLRRLLIFQGFTTLAAAVVLTVAPGVIPGVVGIHLGSNAYMVAYLLAGAEFGFALLSFGGSRLVDPQALRLVAWTCVAFHASSAVLEVYAYAQGTSVLVLSKVVARIIIIALFAVIEPTLADADDAHVSRGGPGLAAPSLPSCQTRHALDEPFRLLLGVIH
jgi:hypothetical protein